MSEAHAWPDNRPVRCANCGWSGDEQDLDWIETFPGRWYEDRHGNPPEPPEGEAHCPKCKQWAYIEDIDGEQDGNENDEEG
jgi:hypothetical protein